MTDHDGRRPLTRTAITGLVSHLAFELGAGVGLPGSGLAGAVPAATAWTVATGSALREAGRRGPEADAALSLVNAFGAAAAVSHLLAWPRRRTALGLPWLEDCEGLGPELMPWYNPIVYGSGALAALAVLVENRSAPRWRTVAAAAAFVPVLVRLQARDFEQRRDRARTRPDRWHRRLLVPRTPPQEHSGGREASSPRPLAWSPRGRLILLACQITRLPSTPRSSGRSSATSRRG